MISFGNNIRNKNRDEGKIWTKPAVVIDAPEDDRDNGIVTFGGKVMLNAFNCGFTTPTYASF